MSTKTRTKYLSRSVIRSTRDRSGVHTLEFIGRGLDFHTGLYGFEPSVFYAFVESEIPVPDEVDEAAAACGMVAADHPDMPALRRAVTAALLAEGLLNAPMLLGEMATPAVQWLDGDAAHLQARHREALVQVMQATRCVLEDLRRRALLMGRRPPEAMPEPEREPFITEPVDEPLDEGPEPVIDAEIVDEIASSAPASATVARVVEAIRQAREAELQQRLPGGARRKLAKMPPGIYIVASDSYEPRADLASAMADGQEMGKRREVAVVDWDGEYPVVARRYAHGGRVIYRVEAALRRAAPEEAA